MKLYTDRQSLLSATKILSGVDSIQLGSKAVLYFSSITGHPSLSLLLKSNIENVLSAAIDSKILEWKREKQLRAILARLAVIINFGFLGSLKGSWIIWPVYVETSTDALRGVSEYGCGGQCVCVYFDKTSPMLICLIGSLV